MHRGTEWMDEAKIICNVLEETPKVNKSIRISTVEFKRRQTAVMDQLKKAGLDAAIVYSDEHYNGDVPYLGGNTNITIEPIAGVIGKNGFHILAGLEGGYVAEQLSQRSGAKVHKVEMLKLADEEYPIDAEKVEDVIEEAAGCKPYRIGLLTPRAVIPVSIYEFLGNYLGSFKNIIDVQELYYKIKYEKSDEEMRLIEASSNIADAMVKGMLYILKPGLMETQVAQWGYNIALELGAEEMGFDIMVTSGEANRTLIGKALNRRIEEGDILHIGVAPKRDGLTACQRVSVVVTDDKSKITSQQKFWFDFIEKAFAEGLKAYIHVAENNLPARFQEQALIDYYSSRTDEVSKMLGKPIDFMKQKPYTGTHNGGYTECQEFYGAITLNSHEPLGKQIVTMLDVAVRGSGNTWNDVIIPGLDYIVAEKTLGKYGNKVRVLNNLPVNLQNYVGKGYKL